MGVAYSPPSADLIGEEGRILSVRITRKIRESIEKVSSDKTAHDHEECSHPLRPDSFLQLLKTYHPTVTIVGMTLCIEIA
jgi:hypothetical protein